MSTGQTSMVIGAFLLLSTVTLSVNTRILDSESLGLEMETTLDALSYAQSLLDEILTKEFDERTTGGERAFSPDDISAAGDFGTDFGESVGGIDSSRSGNFRSSTAFDDVDDYHGYTRLVWNSKLGWFTIRSTVEYVDEDAPDAVVSVNTFYKRITASVSHPNLRRDPSNEIIPLETSDISVYRRYF